MKQRDESIDQQLARMSSSIDRVVHAVALLTTSSVGGDRTIPAMAKRADDDSRQRHVISSHPTSLDEPRAPHNVQESGRPPNKLDMQQQSSIERGLSSFTPERLEAKTSEARQLIAAFRQERDQARASAAASVSARASSASVKTLGDTDKHVVTKLAAPPRSPAGVGIATTYTL